MKQVSLGLNLSTKKTRKREFLEQMNKVVPWDVLVGVVQPHWPKSKTGRPPFAPCPPWLDASASAAGMMGFCASAWPPDI